MPHTHNRKGYFSCHNLYVNVRTYLNRDKLLIECAKESEREEIYIYLDSFNL